ncbi:MAG: EAL domain-containing protein [Acidimicrobiia bacterium]|nr:EAL domain-containing protein [Acidimicrobiia bacterium]
MSRIRPVFESVRRPEPYATVAAWSLLRAVGLVAPIDWWVLVATAVGAMVASDVATALCDKWATGWRLWLRLTAQVAGMTAIMYATGWGSMLAIGYVFSLGDAGRYVGSAATRPVATLGLLGMAAGQLAVQVGVAPTIVDTPDVHGLAALAALGFLVAVRMVDTATRGRERAEEEARQSEDRFRALVANASDVIVVFEPTGDVAYVSPAFERVLGHPPAERMELADFVHPDDRAQAARVIGDVREHRDRVASVELRLRDEQGDWHWFEVFVTNLLDDPSVGGLVGNLREVTERRLFEQQLRYQAYHDALTRLPNRLAFLERLREALARASVDPEGEVAVLFLDVDRFKLVNDSLGHEVGDRLLVEVAERLRTCLRPRDLVARFGGDEFTVLLEGPALAAGAVIVAERITEALRQPVRVGGRDVFVTSSVGISVSGGGDDASDLLREADLAMYLAKEKGRARWEVFDAHSAPQVVERLELEGELWRAVEDGELVVHYQPEVSLAGGSIVTLEALVRWDHPIRGLLLPSTFVPFAEESSLVVAIDRYVLREACRWIRRWRESGRVRPGVRVSVNLSPRFVRQLEAVEDVMGVLAETGADPRCLQIEITERTALADDERTVETLRALRELGIGIAIDDFGTGYSSLAYLKRLPVDVLKLDRSFVEAMDTVAVDAAIVEAVVSMGRAIGLRVVAEGVERAEQAELLASLGCDTAQGTYYAEALAPPAVEELLAGPIVGRREGRVLPFPIAGDSAS